MSQIGPVDGTLWNEFVIIILIPGHVLGKPPNRNNCKRLFSTSKYERYTYRPVLLLSNFF